MRAVHSWLAEYLPGLPDARTCAAALTRAGLTVELVTEAGAELVLARGSVVVGEVTGIEELTEFKKPIRYCQVVTVEGGQPRGIVCGARNFAVGDRVAVALPGAVLPGGFVISARTTYGRVSDGMICSARELGAGEDHAGILVLPPETPLGADVVALLGLPDTVLDLEVTSDRGYALSHRGLARELAAAFELAFTDPAAAAANTAHEAFHASGGAGGPAVRIDDEAGCQRYVARAVGGIDALAPTPLALQQRLTLAGMRPISPAVDVTNLVLLGLGQPLHAFDRDTLIGGLVVRRARDGERLRTLDGVDRTLDDEDLVIADDTGPVALAGVMGGAATEVSKATTQVVLESARFDPVSVARTARRHGLPSEASRRFERGVDPDLAPAATEVAAQMLAALGGQALPGTTDIDRRAAVLPVALPLAECERLAGRPYPPEAIRRRLEQVGCTVVDAGATSAGVQRPVLQVLPPSWRGDLTRPADLVEEVVRLEGYDTIGSVLPRAVAGQGLTGEQRLRRRMATALSDAGFTEVLLLPFVPEAAADQLGLGADDERRRACRVANPLADDDACLRTTLLPGLFVAAARNVSRGNADLALSETGVVFRPPASGAAAAPPVPGVTSRPSPEALAALDASLPLQPRHVAVVLTGRQPLPAVDAASSTGASTGGRRPRPVDWADAVEAAHVLARAAGAPLAVRASATMPWHPGRCAELRIDDPIGRPRVIGYAGELHPRVVAAYGLPARTCALELDLDAVVRAAAPVPAAPRLSAYPPADRDVAVVVAPGVTAAEVDSALRAGAGPLLEQLSLFDVYAIPAAPLGEATGEAEPATRSLAFRLRWRAADRTMTAEEVNGLRDAAVQQAHEHTGAQLRT